MVYRLILLLASFSLLGISSGPVRPSEIHEDFKGEDTEVFSSTTPASKFDHVLTDVNDYIWPTDASRKLTSSFAEYRTTHFHGGIDISTNGKTGYNVFAVRDGYVARIRIAPNGYGKMLYVRHRDGYYSTYAHLKSFSDEINSLAKKEQLRHQTFAIDLLLDSTEAPVRKGEVIAHTGDTGFGPPHLHFEIRDENLNPFNPMLCPAFEVRDEIAPSIRRIMISPLDHNSTVENVSKSKILSRIPRKGTTLRIPQTIRVHGLIGLSVDAIDRSNGTYSKAGIYRLEFFVDDSLIFVKQLDRVPADETKQIDLDYDFPTLLRGWGKFQKLYVETGNTLPFYEKMRAGTGIINTQLLTEGEHDYRIVCSDIRGNATQLTGKLIANHQPSFQIDHIHEEDVTLSGTQMASIERVHLYGKRNSDVEWKLQTFERGRFERDGEGIELPAKTQQYDVIKIVAESKWGSRSAPMFHFLKIPTGTRREIQFSTEVTNTYVRFNASATGVFTTPPIVTIQEGTTSQTVRLDAIDLYKFSGTYTPSRGFAGRRVASVRGEINGHSSAASESFELIPVPSDSKGVFALDERRFVLSFDSGAVYAPVNLQFSSESFRNSTVYILEPQDILLNRGLTISLRPESGRSSTRLGLYFRSNGGWVFQSADADAHSGAYTTTVTRTLGEFALMEDGTEPTVGRLRVSPRGGKLHVSFRYHDNLSGVDTDEIKMYIDGDPVIPEIDGERKNVWLQSDERLERGKHTLRITMKDRMKNATEVTRSFVVR